MRRLRIVGTLGEIYMIDNKPVTSETWAKLYERAEASNRHITLELQEQYSNEAIWGNAETENTIRWETIAEFKSQD